MKAKIFRLSTLCATILALIGCVGLEPYVINAPEDLAEKIKIKFVNCTGPDGSVLSGDSSPSTYCGSRDENQIMYVYNDYGGSLPYSSARYPEVSFS